MIGGAASANLMKQHVKICLYVTMCFLPERGSIASWLILRIILTEEIKSLYSIVFPFIIPHTPHQARGSHPLPLFWDYPSWIIFSLPFSPPPSLYTFNLFLYSGAFSLSYRYALILALKKKNLPWHPTSPLNCHSSLYSYNENTLGIYSMSTTGNRDEQDKVFVLIELHF